MEKEQIIDETNFEQYFRDVRKNKPEKGDIIACYTAFAYLEAGDEKMQLIELLQGTKKAEAATQVMRKLLCASEKDSMTVLRHMAEDLVSGMSIEEVNKKPYKYTFQMYFYTKPEYFPHDDPHWSTISILNTETFADKAGNKITIKTKQIEIENDIQSK